MENFVIYIALNFANLTYQQVVELGIINFIFLPLGMSDSQILDSL